MVPSVLIREDFFSDVGTEYRDHIQDTENKWLLSAQS